MPTLELTAYKLLHIQGAHGIRIRLDIGQGASQRRCEVKSLADIKRELKAFAADMEKTGKPWMCSTRVIGRAPNGYNKADLAKELNAYPNRHLCDGDMPDYDWSGYTYEPLSTPNKDAANHGYTVPAPAQG